MLPVILLSLLPSCSFLFSRIIYSCEIWVFALLSSPQLGGGWHCWDKKSKEEKPTKSAGKAHKRACFDQVQLSFLFPSSNSNSLEIFFSLPFRSEPMWRGASQPPLLKVSFCYFSFKREKKGRQKFLVNCIFGVAGSQRKEKSALKERGARLVKRVMKYYQSSRLIEPSHLPQFPCCHRAEVQQFRYRVEGAGGGNFRMERFYLGNFSVSTRENQ